MRSSISDILDCMLYKEPFCVGEVDFGDDFITEKTIGDSNFGGKIGRAVIEIRADEGDNIPHFHIISKSGNVSIAVRIDVAGYFDHPHAPNVFYNSKQTKVLDKFLREPYKGKDSNKSTSRWDEIVRFHNMSHPDAIITVEEQPDYTKLVTNRKGRLK